MDEIKLFDEINKIKFEIEKDLITVEKLQSHLNLKSIYENNKNLNTKLISLSSDFNININELKAKNGYLEKEVFRLNDSIVMKDKEIFQLKNNNLKIIEENEILDSNLNIFKSIYLII
jgi:hypothetical protein